VHLLDAGIFPSSIFDHAGIRDVIAQHYQRKHFYEYLLSLLSSYGHAMKYFLHDDLADVPANMYAPNSRGRRSGNE